MLTKEELQRYDRQIIIYGFGEEGQEKLKKAKVFLAGAGGLGSSVAIYLTAAGIGALRIADHDKVELSNLNRQVLHWEEDIGKRKAESAAAKLGKLNHSVKIETIAETITEANISKLISDADVIVDAMDNLPTRYLLNRTAVEKGIPFFHGAVYGFEGRAMTVLPRKTACLNCLYHGTTVPKEKFPVIGVTPAVIGCIQATEVIKYITGLGELLTNRLLNFDGLRMKFNEFKINRDPNCEVCGKKTKQGKKQ
ncbi:MAG: HesA/MoeB/ThiF family protein [Dehalococcoidales bacterium]|nr:HesA/MoeB/ThiF family protein [Dehalococcoidales bacterium]